MSLFSDPSFFYTARTMTLPEKVFHALHRQQMLSGGEKVLVAVSGGADSTALLYVMHYLAKKLHLELLVVHLNHSLRGKESDRDARFVKMTAWRLGIPCICRKTDIKKLAGQAGISLEMAARQARYAFFRDVSKAHQANCVAVAHNADDQVETVILKLARGSVAGLRGMAAVTEQDGLMIIRPMLDIPRHEIVDFLEANRLLWTEDSSNRDLVHLRNRVRHEILPLCEERLNPQFRKAVLQIADIVGADAEWLDELTPPLVEKCSLAAEKGGLQVSKLAALPLGARRRVMMAWLHQYAGPDAVTFDTLNRLEKMIQSEEGSSTIPLSGGGGIARHYGCLSYIQTLKEACSEYEVEVAVPGNTMLPACGLRVVTIWTSEICKQTGGRIGIYPAWASVRADLLAGRSLTVRSWHPGDHFSPFGMKGGKKLQDIYVDAKIPRRTRNNLPVFVVGEEVVWVPGYQVSKSAAVSGKESRYLFIRIEPACRVG